MGIYPVRHTEDHRATQRGEESWVEVEREPGIERRRRVHAGMWMVTRTDCFCCSCGELHTDPACRNHGFAAKRPCELHNMPGQVWDHSGEMPEPVQAVRIRRADL